MKCIKCKAKNICKANYCKKCGYHFSDDEQKAAKNKTLVGKLEKLEDLYNKFTLKFITDHIAFKIISLLIVFFIGLSFLFNYGNSLKILESEEYTIRYNGKSKEYYLMTDNDQITLNLYMPNRLTDLKIIYQDPINNISSTIEYQDENDLILTANGGNDEYILAGTYSSNKNEEIKLYVYKIGDIYE